jgi:hypothetical protein
MGVSFFIMLPGLSIIKGHNVWTILCNSLSPENLHGVTKTSAQEICADLID